MRNTKYLVKHTIKKKYIYILSILDNYNKGLQVALNILAFFFSQLGCIRTVKEFALEELDSYHGEDELEQHVDYHDAQNVLQRIHHAVKDRLQDETNNLSLVDRIRISRTVPCRGPSIN